MAALLGVSSASLYRGLTTRTHNVRGQLVKSMCDANMVRRGFFKGRELYQKIPAIVILLVKYFLLRP